MSVIPKRIEVLLPGVSSSTTNVTSNRLLSIKGYLQRLNIAVKIVSHKISSIFYYTEQWLNSHMEIQNLRSRLNHEAHLKIWNYLIENEKSESACKLQLIFMRFCLDIKVIYLNRIVQTI